MSPCIALHGFALARSSSSSNTCSRRDTWFWVSPRCSSSALIKSSLVDAFASFGIALVRRFSASYMSLICSTSRLFNESTVAILCLLMRASARLLCVLGRAGLGHLAVLLCEHLVRGDVGDARLDLVLPPAYDIRLAGLHGLEAIPGHRGGIIFLVHADFRIHEVGPLEELRFGRAGHEARDRNIRILQLVPQRERKGVDEGFGAVVDRLERSGH